MKKRNLLFGLTLVGMLTLGSVSLTSCGGNAPSDVGVLIQGAKTVNVGKTISLTSLVSGTEEGVDWAVSDGTIASIDEKGVLTGLKVGEVEVYCFSKLSHNVKDTVKIKVVDGKLVVYDVQFVNSDGTLLYQESVEEGKFASYDVSTIPSRLSSDLYTYSFTGWSQSLDEPIYMNTTFVAQYSESPIDFNKFSFALTSSGTYNVGYSGTEEEVTLPTSYNYRKVVGIKDSGFYNNKTIKKVNMGEDITYIGMAAFQGCTALTEFEFPSKLRVIDSGAFYGCKGLTSLVFPSSLLAVGQAAFTQCVNLVSVTLNEGLQELYKQAFEGDEKLTSINIPSTLTAIGESCFSGTALTGDLVIPSSLTTLGDDAFAYSKLTSVSVPKETSTIDGNPFHGIMTLKSITFDPANSVYSTEDGVLYSKDFKTLIQVPASYPKDVCNIKEGVETVATFSGTYCNVKEVHFPKSVKTFESNSMWLNFGVEKFTFDEECEGVVFGQYTFGDSAKLVSLHLPKGVEEVPSYFVNDSPLLSDFTMPETVLKIGRSAFDGTSITSINIPKYIQTIEDDVFSETKLTSVVLPDTVTYLGGSAFDDCTELVSVTLSPNIIEMGGRVFSGCSKLAKAPILPKTLVPDDGYIELPYGTFEESGITSCVVPDGYTSLGNYAFSGAMALKEITVPASLKIVNKWCFGFVTDLKINFKGTKAQFDAITVNDELSEYAGDNTAWHKAASEGRVVYDYKG